MAVTHHLGLDLGGTNIKWSVVSREGDEWTSLAHGQLATDADEGADAVVQRLADAGREALTAWPGVVTIGVGVPGSYDPRAGTTRFLNNVPGEWDGRPLAAELSAGLGLPCALINDARAFGLAELRLGAGRGAQSMIGLTLGTGVGGVVAIDGRIHHGHDGSAGEIGHQTIDLEGPDCTCGGRGCLEAFINGDAIAADCGTETVADAVAAARAGDERASAGMARVGHLLGIGIANMVNVFTPDRVVIGGGTAAALDLLIEPIWSEIRDRVHFTPLDRLQILPAQLGVWAGAIGAAIHGAETAPSAAD
jgi:glucokinase